MNSSKDMLQSLFDTAQAQGQAPAVYSDGTFRSYTELASDIHRLIQELDLYRTPRRLVVNTGKNAFLCAAILASLHTGNVCIPLSPAQSDERKSQILEIVEPDLILCDRRTADESRRLAGRSGSARVVDIQTLLDNPPAADHDRARPEARPAAATDVAYILFTSGSTGQPKGVPITFGNLRAFMDGFNARHLLPANGRFTALFEPTFDLFFHDLLMALTHAGCLFLVARNELFSLPSLIRKHEINVWHSVPSVVNLLEKLGVSRLNFPRMKLCLFCGEALNRNQVELWARACPNADIVNVYGPTECTISASSHRCHGPDAGLPPATAIMPIGRPYPGIEFGLADENDRLIEGDARTGRLLIRGDNVFGGYISGRAGDCFLREAGGRADDRPWYITGDIASRDATGVYFYHGRIDRQVKINGHRIELQEVEMIFAGVLGVNSTAVLPMRDQGAPSFNGVHVFYSADGARAVEDVDALPYYLRHFKLHRVETFPANANGKVDYKQLERLTSEDPVPV